MRVERTFGPSATSADVANAKQDKADTVTTQIYAVSAKSEAPSEPKGPSSGSLKPVSGGGFKGLGSSSKALPPIGGNKAPLGAITRSIDERADALEERKKLAEDAFRKNQNLLTEQRRNEDESRNRVIQGLATAASSNGGSGGAYMIDEASERARYMQEQRDRLVTMKKLERDKKVKLEDERRKVAEGKSGEVDIERENLSKFIQAQKNSNNQESSASELAAEEAERKRAQLRRAMAMQIKQDLYESEEAKHQAQDEAQFADLDRKLRQMQQMQQINQQRSAIISEQMRQQQALLAKKTSASLKREA